jgi:hypothetical protein
MNFFLTYTHRHAYGVTRQGLDWSLDLMNVYKDEVVPVLNYLCTVPWKYVGGGEWIDSHFIDLGTSLRWWMVRFMPWLIFPEERVTGTHCIRDWVGPRAGLNDMEKRRFLTLPRLKLQPLSRTACNQSLSLLHYPGSCEHLHIVPTNNYSAVTNVHTLQFTAACTESSQSAVSSPMSSASMLMITMNFLLFWLPTQNSTVLTPMLVGISQQPPPLCHQTVSGRISTH